MDVLRLVRRVIVRLILIVVLAWFALAFLWAALPSPSREHGHSDHCSYAVHALRSGRVLTRVYRYMIYLLPTEHRHFCKLETNDTFICVFFLVWNRSK